MTKADKGIHRKTRSKAKEASLDKEALGTELERMYIRKHFYDTIGSFFANVVLAIMGICVFLVFFLPGAQHGASIGFTFWLHIFVMCKYIVRYKGTKHELYGKELFEMFFEVVFSMHEFIQVRFDLNGSEEGRNSHLSMVVLAIYCIGCLVLRVAFPKYKRRPLVCVTIPLTALKYPRFGIFGSHYEALAWFIALSLGFAIGGVIDEMRWRHFLLLHEKELEMEKKSKELLKESRKRAMAMEVLSSYEDKQSFFEIR